MRTPVLLLATLGVAACSSNPTPDASDVTGNDAMLTDAADMVDDTDAADITDTTDTTPMDAAIGSGSVSVEVSEPVALANFFVSFAQGISTCNERDEGPCHVSVCPLGHGNGTTSVSAGDVTASGGTGSPIVTQFMSGAYTVPAALPASRWQAGDTVSVTAAGATVPAFDAMLTFPTPLMVTSPSTAGNSFPPINRSVDLVITWSPTTGSSDTAVIVQQTNTSNAVTVTCRFDRRAGTGTIPTTALQDLQPGMGSSNTAQIAIAAQNAQYLSPGGYVVQVRAASVAVLTSTAVE